MAPTPYQKSLIPSCQTLTKTPQSKHRLNFPNPKGSTYPHTSLNPLSITPTEHPVEVISRIRDLPDRKDKSLLSSSALEITGDGRSLRVRSDVGYRDFSLDGVSLSENEDLEGFYRRFVESRVKVVRSGANCTIMMYGPTGAGKSHTMFGGVKDSGIVYRALKDILGEGDRDGGMDVAGFGITLFVQVAVLEVYNEEIYDLLSGWNGNGAGTDGIALPKGSTPKARLEVMGRKAKNATYICGNEAGKISREVAKVEKRRIVKSTLLNERSSRSHCVIILDVPSVGGRLMLVDMAGSENIEQAGQVGFEAKMQTAKINQGNIALKRVVESIANGDSHIPFRDSKLTMLLQDSFEDDKSKILMILCASPDPKEMHKTIATLEYGAKAKCIVRVAHMPTPREKLSSEDSSALLRSRIVAMNQFIYNLQIENKLKDKEFNKVQRELLRKEEEILGLHSKLQLIEGMGAAKKEEEIKCLVDERTQALNLELKEMEKKMHQQEEELHFLRKQLEGMESTKCALHSHDRDGVKFVERLAEMCVEDQGMEKSMELDMGDLQPIHDITEIIKEQNCPNFIPFDSVQQDCNNSSIEEDVGFHKPKFFPDMVCLSTIFERDDEGDDRKSMEEEVDKGVVEKSIGLNVALISKNLTEDPNRLPDVDNGKDSDFTRRTRIQNIFRLCGNHRELAQQAPVPTPMNRKPKDASMQSSPSCQYKELITKESHSVEFVLQPKPSENSISRLSASERETESKENKEPLGVEAADMMNVCVRWEASKELSRNMIMKLSVRRNSTLSDLRKLIETHLEEASNNQAFTFLLLADPLGAPVPKEKEATVFVSKLPTCNNQLNSHLACLRPTKNTVQWPNQFPFSSLENTL
ncbi:hypothetical protein IEQ34_001763 [Dendrobium chrysotoxum]|uniref:Kinesin-like protein KIN-10A n=1 Tax=Dendrobium chrysotoxum TaxID=161865 RepID=A0AAV7H7Q9_DENCH|nr:hypothetical protein IEQ34_001763 [Dendrobium chrysotoxum]